MMEDHCLQQLQKGLVENFESLGIGAAICLWEKKEAIPLLTEEAVEEHQDHNLPLPPTGSVYILLSPTPQSQPKTPTANAQATYNQLPGALYLEPLYTLPTTQFTPAAQFTPEAPTTKATPSLLVLQNIRKLVAIVRAFATTLKTQAAAHIAWHSGWFGYQFVHLTSCGTLVILITSTGELLLYFTVIFFSFHIKK